MTNYTIAEIQAFIAQFYAGQKLLLVPYGYTTTFLALAQGATQTASVNVAANADFLMLSLRHRAQIGAAQTVSTKTAPFVRVLITDTGSNEQFTNAAVDLENYSVNGESSIGGLPFPRLMAGRSTFQVQVTNYAPTAETYTSLDLFFSGLLIRAFQQ